MSSDNSLSVGLARQRQLRPDSVRQAELGRGRRREAAVSGRSGDLRPWRLVAPVVGPGRGPRFGTPRSTDLPEAVRGEGPRAQRLGEVARGASFSVSARATTSGTMLRMSPPNRATSLMPDERNTKYF